MRGDLLYLVLTFDATVIVWRGPTPGYRKVLLLVSLVVLGFLRYDLPDIHCIVEGYLARLELAFLKKPMVTKLVVAFLPCLFVGRIFCGYVCPKGGFQEVLYLRRISSSISRSTSTSFRVPPAVDRLLRLGPYLTCTAMIAAPLAFEYRLWTNFDPFLWVFHGHGHLPGLVLLVALAPLCLVMCRPFCRYLCPLVPFFRLFSRAAWSGRRVEARTCRGCRSGVQSCDFGVVSRKSSSLEADQGPTAQPSQCQFSSAECLQCGRCRQSCPKGAIR